MRWFVHTCAVLALFIYLPGPTAEAAKRWYIKENCEYVENPANDGDSFHVRIKGRRYFFRLYWVDTPESDDSYPERVAEQAAYFGISDKDAIRIGKKATEFTRAYLKNGFTTYTKYQDARGNSKRDRDYGLIETDAGDLGVALVENGLARIHGFQEVHDDYMSESSMRLKLKSAEADAKRNKRGAWALSEGGGQELPEIPTGPFTLSRSVMLLDPEQPSRQLGLLRTGAEIDIVGMASTIHAKVVFTTGDGRKIEGLVMRASLGI